MAAGQGTSKKKLEQLGLIVGKSSGGVVIAKAKKGLQVAAKQHTNDPKDKFSKEATVSEMKITTQEQFMANTLATPVSLEAGADLPIGHPVVGTGKGAIYHVVAKLDGLQIAMRWKGGQLSIRVAGPKLAEYAPRLKAPGTFADHSAEGYFSAHLGQQGTIDDIVGSVAAQMLYASVLATFVSDLSTFTERTPYAWRNWLKPPAAA